jgi:hypothetical protein
MFYDALTQLTFCFLFSGLSEEMPMAVSPSVAVTDGQGTARKEERGLVGDESHVMICM